MIRDDYSIYQLSILTIKNFSG